MSAYMPQGASLSVGMTVVRGSIQAASPVAGVAGASLGTTIGELLKPKDKFKAPPCYNICAQDYNTTCSAEPSCEKGGFVYEAKDCNYDCDTASCGGASGKKVSIEIYDSKKKMIKEDSATTDAEGYFDYTFKAPNYSDTFTAKLSVEEGK